ncbi:hypothetical protein M8818_001277 [Zalaria obscura]|uniref:Uncharacterized protein n=1 Tax=Zalaria obscura TaxID=2024903 RepID=A0ACC3SKP8_9PEZI
MRDALHRRSGNRELRWRADTWRRRGKAIHSVRDLILCYYASFIVVRIPVKGRAGMRRVVPRKVERADAIKRRRVESVFTKRLRPFYGSLGRPVQLHGGFSAQ